VNTNQIDLVWRDLSTNEESFKIERSTNGIDFISAFSVPANRTNGSDYSLSAGTTYFYRLKANNAAGDSDYSDVAQATTLQPPPPPPDTNAPAAVTNLVVANITSNSVTLFWTAAGDDGNIGTAAAYDIRFSTDGPITETNFTAATQVTGAPVPVPSGNSQAYAIQNLQPATTYWFALKTLDETNNVSPISNVPEVNTPAADAPLAPSGLSAIAIATNEVDLAWMDNASNEDNFQVERSSNQLDWIVIAVASSNVTNYMDLDVLANTTYFYQVRSVNGSGNSPPSNIAQATTPQIIPPDTTPPAGVKDLVVKAVTSNTVTLTWTAPGDDGNAGTAASYDLRISTDLIAETNWLAATSISGLPAPLPVGSTQSLILTGLQPGTTYYFALKASDLANNVSLLSDVASGTTAGLPPPWADADIGSVKLTGQASFTNGVFTVLGAGSDIGSSADSFNFVCQNATGDCEIVARVLSVQNTSSSAKAGVMIRDTLKKDAKFAMTAITPGKKILWLRRTSSGGSVSTSTVSGTFNTPQWLRVTRTNSTFTSYYSTDGIKWIQAGSKSITMGSNVVVGLGVTSKTTSKLNTSTFDRVTAQP
jgi:hypothetical protein